MIMASDFNQGQIGSKNMMSKSMMTREQMQINEKMAMFQSSLPTGLLGGGGLRMSNFEPDAGNN